MTFINYLKGYRVRFSKEADAALDKIDRHLADRIRQRFAALASGEQGLDVKKLEGYKEPRYRLRVGHMRAIYAIIQEEIVISVISIAHRKDAYEKKKLH